MPYTSIFEERTFYRQNHRLETGLKTLLFIHGAGGNGGHWIYQLAGIKGYNLIALDLPGHGRSEGSAADSITAYREFVWQFTQVLNLKNIIVVGHSMGGAIALDLTLKYPEFCMGLVIVDSGARLRVNPALLELLAKGEQPVETIKFCYSKKVSSDLLAKANQEMKKVPSHVFLADFRACDTFDIVDHVKSIQHPTLIICGQEDRMTPPKYSEYLVKNLPQSNLAYISDAGHMTMLEQPHQVNKAILSFLTQSF
ncbi:putative hydrolase or acyltransferase of alpha/beta superfamily [Desulfosporosinus orientis DSM 765]|uniref:Putative hydrolase or acyltransferase of alpha/beta superfamily n=1 Tax=Desulfosporosinus orientis (strain ATCC 19365 / DSM 765 / NCIMB 8382 / VKM B-1628 / Singapore I) TaxID=768706 RepID=G7WBQ4_DESOD|nr:alpha/beta hydrolase [Desulfosporosinus orientis]AET68812.1 putative hydrolase or acyltransferase of alpha/beta superfamily [Desulfosporosinus orientis DSM 765]